MSLARYDLHYEHPTFDFFGWAIMAVAAGATGFVTNDKIDDADTLRRLESIILPGAELFGLPITRADDGGRRFRVDGDYRWRLRHFVAWTRKHKFKRLQSIKPPAKQRYTVTLRNSRVDKYRNSNANLWLDFADAIGAYVIEDYYDKPIDLHDRLALYAGAEMNFGVWSGPLWLITLTNYPLICTNWGVDEPVKIQNSGIAIGESPPWLAANQTTIWEKAEEKVLHRLWKEHNIKQGIYTGQPLPPLALRSRISR